jgi:tRNA-dihydrouridine synthase A
MAMAADQPLSPAATAGNKELHIAPMLNYSTREFRQLMRILSTRLTLWTEMVVDETIAHATKLDEHLAYDDMQHPIVCQIGGNSPRLCGKATSIVLERYGYDEVNLNIDCPSERVSGRREFGACLMKKAKLAREIVGEMQANAPPSAFVSVKCRIGVDDWDSLDFAADFIRTLQPVCQRFYLHARKCVLGGIMNARQNRSVPPLDYPRVYALCDMFPDCHFWINGGIRTLEEARLIVYGWKGGCSTICDAENDANRKQQNCHQVPCAICNLPYGSCTQPPVVAPSNLRGCMLGRAAMDDPSLFYNADKYFFGEASNPCTTRRDVLERYCVYLEKTYPRRCCDSDVRITFEYPAPKVAHERDCCKICSEIYSQGQISSCPGGSDENEANSSSKDKDKDEKVAEKKKKRTRSKMSSRIIARCLKPVQGIFAGIPDSREFRRKCDDLGQNDAIRNCGPGFLLRMAMRSVSDDILDSPL